MIKLLFRHEINVFGLDMMIPPDMAVMQLIGYVSAQEQLHSFHRRNLPAIPNALDRPQMWRTVGWLVKLGVLGRKRA